MQSQTCTWIDLAAAAVAWTGRCFEDSSLTCLKWLARTFGSARHPRWSPNPGGVGIRFVAGAVSLSSFERVAAADGDVEVAGAAHSSTPGSSFVGPTSGCDHRTVRDAKRS